MNTHAALSPSARYRWSACPGSVREAARYTEGKSSPGAIDGTHSHTLLEHCLKNSHPPKHYLGMLLQDHEGMFGVEMDRVERVNVAYEYVKARSRDLPECIIISEQRVDPAPLVGRKDMSGTADVQLHSGDFFEVIDYKDGLNPVEAKDNQQLLQYAVGIVAGIYDRTGTFPYKHIRLTIIQPKLAVKGMDPISSHDYEADVVMGEVMKLICEGAATDDPQAPLVPGDKQCSYCPHRANCVPFNQWVLERSGIKFEAVVETAAAQQENDMPDEQLRQIIEAAPLLRKMIEGAEAEAVRRISAGKPIVGLKLVHGRGTRSWAQEEAETAGKLTRMGIPKKEVYRQVLISPSQAEKLKWQKRDGSEGCLTEKQIERLNKEFVKKSEGKLTVAPESDRRSAVDFGDLSKMFAAIPQESLPAEVPVPAWLS